MRVSDPGRSAVDLLDYPRMVGGLRRAAAQFQRILPELNVGKVARHAARGSRSSTCQRLGVLLERGRASSSNLALLRRRIEETRSLTSLVPGPRRGRVNRAWNVVENDGALDPSPTP